MINFTTSWWPRDQERLANYARRKLLYESNHTKAFEHLSAKLPEHLRQKLYLIQDYPKLVTDVYADLVFGAAPVFSLPGQQKSIDDLVRQNSLKRRFYEAELSCSYHGDAVFKLSVGPLLPGGPLRVRVEEVQAYTYFVELDPDNCNRVLSQCLAWIRTVGDGEDQKRYLRVEHHLPGKVLNQVFELVGYGQVYTHKQRSLSVLYGNQAPDEEEKTRVDYPLLVHVPNVQSGGNYFGNADYTTGLESLFNEANGRITAIADILYKHGNPKLITTPGMLDRKGNVKVGTLDVIEVWPEDAVAGAPRMLTWDPHLSSQFDLLEACEEKIFQFADISPAMFGKDKAGNIESGRAMAMRFARMMTRTNRKRLYRETALRHLFHVAQLLQAAWSKEIGETYPEPSGDIEIVWRNGLPKDDKELTDVATRQVQARIMSRETAIRYVNQVGADEAQAELARIDADNPTPTPPQASGGNPEIIPGATDQGPPAEV